MFSCYLIVNLILSFAGHRKRLIEMPNIDVPKPMVMTAIIDQHGETVAYLHLNIIINTTKDTVLGLLLGNCVFGEAEAPVGKFFKDSFRNMSGKVVAVLGQEVIPGRPANEPDILQQAWTKLTAVKNHLCMWVEEGDSWSDDSFYHFLQTEQLRAVAV